MSQASLPLAGEREIWAVSEILGEARWALETTFTGLWIRGEVTSLRQMRTGHWYFSLKDEDAVLPVAMFRSDNLRVPFSVEEGMEVVAQGRLSIYEPQGRFQLIASALEPAGLGAQQLAYEQLKQRLKAEGLFDPSSKQALPALPSCVGVVTSASGAAWHDMRKVWSRRGVAVRALLSPARVQGEFAPSEIAEAIRLLRDQGESEVLIVGRGGGSREDLWAFNDEVVARAIAECPIPIIAAVGHETDFSIADLVADARAATPTAAAEIVAPSSDELARRVTEAIRRSGHAMHATAALCERRLNDPRLARSMSEPQRLIRAHQQRLDAASDKTERALESRRQEARTRVAAAAATLLRRDPGALLAQAERRLARSSAALRGAMDQRLRDRRDRLATTAARTEAMNPLAVLGRGYALCQAEDGSVLSDATRSRPGDDIQVRLARGQLECTVTRSRPDAGDH